VRDLRKEARGKECQIRLSGICNFDNATTVLAHVRLIGISGGGYKAPDILGAHACSACHAYVDSHHDDKTRADFADGVHRTIFSLWKRGLVVLK